MNSELLDFFVGFWTDPWGVVLAGMAILWAAIQIFRRAPIRAGLPPAPPPAREPEAEPGPLKEWRRHFEDEKLLMNRRFEEENLRFQRQLLDEMAQFRRDSEFSRAQKEIQEPSCTPPGLPLAHGLEDPEATIARIRERARDGKSVSRQDLDWLLSAARPPEDASPEDVRKAIELFDRLGRRRAEEYPWPPFFAYIDRNACQAITLRLSRQYHLTVDNVLGDFEKLGETRLVTLFDHEVSVGVTEAIAVAPPFVRLFPGASQETVERLRPLRVSFAVDGVDVSPGARLEDFLVGLDGWPVRARPWQFHPESLPREISFAGRISKAYGYPNGPIEPSDCLMCSVGRTISFRVEFPPLDLGNERRLVAGLVAAVYTTKDLE